jgi:hypothetical protein
LSTGLIQTVWPNAITPPWNNLHFHGLSTESISIRVVLIHGCGPGPCE